MKTTVVASEVRMFWRFCQDLKSDDTQIVAEAVDDLEVLRLHTDNLSLKDQCSRMIERVAARATGSIERKAQG